MTLTIKGEMPVKFPFKPMKVGQDYAFTIYFKDDNRAAKNTTGWSMEIKGRENNANGDEVFSLTVGSGITHTAAEGKFAVKIADTITSLIDVGTVAVDVKVTDSNGDITFPLEGEIEIKETVTR